MLEIGFGEKPVTALEFRQKLADRAAVEFWGAESELTRVRAAGEAGLDAFLVEGFELSREPWDLIRAFNVLRAYPAEQVSVAWKHWSDALAPGARLLEGSTDPLGHIATFVEIDRTGATRRMVFLTDFERGFAPMMFRDWLPRMWRRGMNADDPLLQFLESWQATFSDMHEPGAHASETFARVAQARGFCGYFEPDYGVVELECAEFTPPHPEAQ